MPVDQFGALPWSVRRVISNPATEDQEAAEGVEEEEA